MRRRPGIPFALLLIATWGTPLLAQSTAQELAERPTWEAFLAAAKVVGQKQLGGENAVTNPWQLTLQEGDVLRKALWKNP